MADRGGAHRLAEPMVHSCGFQSHFATGYAMHAKHCDGTKPATEGRIAAREKETALAIAPAPRRIGRPRKAFVDDRTERPRGTYRKSVAKRRGHPEPAAAPTPGVASIVAVAADQAVVVAIAALRAKRVRLDIAIAALEGLA